MSTPADYSPEEIELLIETPFAVGMAAMMAAESGLGALSELSALRRLILEPPPPLAAHPLIRNLLDVLETRTRADPQAGRALMNPFEGVSRAAMVPTALAKTAQALALLRSRGTAADVASYGQWLLAIGEGVARAAREGSVFGLGGQAVSEPETAFLERLTGLIRP
jgi:hypothetical protein